MITSLLIIVWFKPFFLLSFFFFSCPVKLPAKYSGSLLERQQMGNKFCLPVGSLPWLWMQQNCTRKGTSGNWWESKVWSREGNTEHWTCFSQLRKELCWSMSGVAAEQWFMDSPPFFHPVENTEYLCTNLSAPVTRVTIIPAYLSWNCPPAPWIILGLC